jgi:2'-5' RNA ligase
MFAAWSKGTLSSMAMTQPASAIVVRVKVSRALERARRQWDWAAGVGVPSHVTIVFPFMPVARLTPDVRRLLVAIAAAHEPFDVRFARVGRFPGVVYLTPEPSAPFSRLTEAVVARFPEYPPYDGAFDVVIPHLTLVESAAAPLDGIAEAAEHHLPFTRPVSSLEVLVEGTDARWHSHWRIRLGVRP